MISMYMMKIVKIQLKILILCVSIRFDLIAPYGIREAREKIETKVRRPLKPNSTVDADHYPSTSPYQLSKLYEDLLRFAGERLRIGGRLVCWIPIYK